MTENKILSLKEKMADKMKKLSKEKIDNLYFIVGDVIVRNIDILKSNTYNYKSSEDYSRIMGCLRMFKRQDVKMKNYEVTTYVFQE